MPRWMQPLLLVALASYVLSFLHASHAVLFVLSAIGLVPLAALIGAATEDLAEHVGAAAGGLINATFGNVPELIIGILAVHDGLLTLARSAMIGSVIGNASLVVGMALFYGGVKNGAQRFDSRQVGGQAILMVLAVASLALPSLFSATAPRADLNGLSIAFAGLLIVTYGGYLLYGLAGFHGGTAMENSPPEQPELSSSGEETAPTSSWPWQASVTVLAATTLAVTLVGNVLIDSIRAATVQFGISQFFVGIIVVPIVGNVAEHFAAVQLAGKNKLDLSFAIAGGSAIQVALFVAPVIVMLSFLWHPMTLVFGPIAIAVLALITVIFFIVAQDGRTNWLQGLQLMTLYLMAATVFYYVPAA